MREISMWQFERQILAILSISVIREMNARVLHTERCFQISKVFQNDKDQLTLVSSM